MWLCLHDSREMKNLTCLIYREKTGVESRKDRDFKQVGPGSYSLNLSDKKKEP